MKGNCRAPARYKIGNWIRHEKMVGFFLIGIFASLIDIGLLYLLCTYFGTWYILAATVSYCCGIVASYLLNKYLNFHDLDRHYLVRFSTLPQSPSVDFWSTWS